MNGASGAENSFTVDGVITNSLVNGSSRQDTVFEYLQEVQVKTGGHLGRIRRRTRRRHQRGDQVGRQPVHAARATTSCHGSSVSAGPVKRLQLIRPTTRPSSTYQDQKQRNNRNEVRRLHRRPDRQGPPVLLRLGFATVRVAHEQLRLFSSGTEAGSSTNDQTLTQAFGKVTYAAGRSPGERQRCSPRPLRSNGTLLAYNGTQPQRHGSSSLAGNAARTTRLEQNQRRAATRLLVEHRRSSACAAALHDNYRTRASQRRPMLPGRRRRSASLACPGQSSAARPAPQNTPAHPHHGNDQTKRGSSRSTTTTRSPRRSHIGEGWLRLPPLDERCRSRLTRAVTSCSLGSTFINTAGAVRAEAPTDTTK